MFAVRCLHCLGWAAIVLGLACDRLCAQQPFPAPAAIRSVSGQFIVTGAARSRLADMPAVATNAELIVLEPALLVVSAERIREAFNHILNPELRDLNPVTPPRSKIYLVLHPAQALF